MNNSIQISLLFQQAQNPINILFSKERTFAQFIDWIFDNFNQFLTTNSKQQIQLYSQQKKKYFGYEQSFLHQGLDQNQNTIQVMTKQDVDVNTVKSVFISYEQIKFEINIDLQLVKIADLMVFLKNHFQKDNILLFWQTYCLNNVEQSLTLQLIGIHDKDEIRVQEQIEVQKEKQIQLLINIQDGSLKRAYKAEFSSANTLNDVAQAVMTYLGANGENANVSLQIGENPYNDPIKRNQTLLQLHLQNNQEIQAKMMWIGG